MEGMDSYSRELFKDNFSVAFEAFAFRAEEGRGEGFCYAAGAFYGLPFAGRASFYDDRLCGHSGLDGGLLIGRCIYGHLIHDFSSGDHLCRGQRVGGGAFWAGD